MFAEKPDARFPFFDLENGRVLSFDEFRGGNPLLDLARTIISAIINQGWVNQKN
jgi:hypothetical protein